MVKTIHEPKWYLLYTASRAEKKVDLELRKRGFTTFLPLHKTLRQWSDRKKWVEEPLFKSYLFVNTVLEKHIYEIINTPGAVKFVSFQGKTAIVDERELAMVKRLMGEVDQELEATDYSQLNPGDEIEILGGPLMGTRGQLIQWNGTQKVMVALHSIQQNLILSLPKEMLHKVFPQIVQTA